MGFLDFLKKEDDSLKRPQLSGIEKPDELSFGPQNDDFNAVPKPPKQFKDEQLSKKEPELTESLMPKKNSDEFTFPMEEEDSKEEDFADHNSGLEEMADTPINSGMTTHDAAGVPDIPMPDFGVPQEAAEAPELDLTPEPEPATQLDASTDDTLDIPDLPTLPNGALESTFDEEELLAPTNQKPGPALFMAPAEDVKEQPSSFDPDEPNEPNTGFAEETAEEITPGMSTFAQAPEEESLEKPPAKKAVEKTQTKPATNSLPTLDDETNETSDTPAARIKYLPEHKEEEKPVAEDYYVDSHKFYEILQDIKAVKHTIKDNDTTMKDIETSIGDAETKAESLIGSVDDIQEKLIAIDTGLFER